MRVVRRVLACAVIWAGVCRGDVAVLSATADTYIMGATPDANAGAYTDFVAGQTVHEGVRRALIQFDLSSLPPSAVITSAVVTITVQKGSASVGFDLLAIAAPWTEGAQNVNNGAPAADGECTWNSRHHNVDLWSSPGTDFDPTVLASTIVNATGPFAWQGTGLLAAVQGWVTTPSSNHGLLLRCQDEATARTAYRFVSREGGSAATLDVGYDLPPPPPPPQFIAVDPFPTNTLALTWTNNPGMQYDVLYARSLAGPQDWRLADANIPSHPSGTNVWPDPPVLASPLYATNAFYALAERPASPTALVLRLEVVASNLVSPVAATHAGDGSGRLFIAEQRGQIRILDAATNLLALPFLDLSPLVVPLSSSYDERGLLGLAFHPAYASNRKFYVYYSAPKAGAGINHESILAEYLATTTNANLADPLSARIVLRFDEPEFNHNGGSLAFGPDGFLYISTGDGGGGGDLHGAVGNGQNISNLLGKILRIDVDGGLPYAIPADNPFVAAPGADEIFAYGFRNPWKVIFSGTNLWVADVGQDRWEEINLVRKGGNYGWRIIEGHHAFHLPTAAATGVDVTQLQYPIHEYRHGPLGISIIGGSVYEGSTFPALTNTYVFGDFSTSFGVPDGALYYLEQTRAGIWERFAFYLWPTNGRLQRYVKSFGVDEAGEMYLLSTTNLGPSGLSGDVRRLLPAP